MAGRSSCSCGCARRGRPTRSATRRCCSSPPPAIPAAAGPGPPTRPRGGTGTPPRATPFPTRAPAPFYTRARRPEPHDLPMGEDWYRAQGIDVHDADRGGRVTYHGPGQLVGYPIMRIGDVPAYIHTMEHAILTALADEGIAAEV